MCQVKRSSIKCYINTDSELGMYPVGFAALIFAETKEEAKVKLISLMKEYGLPTTDRFGIELPELDNLEEIAIDTKSSDILVTGVY